MAALDSIRLTTKVSGLSGPTRFSRPVKGDVVIHKGALLASDSDGLAVPFDEDTTLIPIGVAQHSVDTTGLADGAKNVECEPGIFVFENSASSDEITEANFLTWCYGVDDQTVAKTSGSDTRAIAGRVMGIESDGRVRVMVVPGGKPLLSDSVQVIERIATITHADLTDADTSQAVNVGDVLPANARFLGGSVKLNTAFSGGDVSAITVDIGGTDPDGIVDGRDVFTGASTAELLSPAGVLTAAGLMPQMGAQQITATFVSVDDNLVDLTAGSVTIKLYFLPLA